MRRRPMPRSLTVAITATGIAALAPPALAARVTDLEQVNRATGVAGGFGLTTNFPTLRAGGVTDNGRYVFFGVRKPSTFPAADEFAKDLLPGPGLWVRDVQRNTTTRISSDGNGLFTGIDRTSHVVSFITSEGLAGNADTNGKPDLYAYEPLTGIKVLISRANGHGGKAVGLTSFGTVTRGTTVAVFGTEAGIVRRDLLRGRNAKLGDGNFIAPLSADLLFPVIQTTADQYVSNDGRVVTTDAGVVTPGGMVPLPIDEINRPVRPWVNEAGSKLIWQASIQALDRIRVYDVATKVATAPTIPAEFADSPTGVVHRPTPDGSGVILGYTEEVGPAEFEDTVKKWSFASGAVTDLGGLGSLSRNERFGLSGSWTGALLVGGTPGNSLPGGIDLPSAIAYLRYDDSCSWDENGRRITVAPAFTRNLPKATTARLRAAAAEGQPWVVDQTVDVPADDGYYPESEVALPFADGAFHLEVTLTLADGRTITSTVDHGPRSLPDCG